MASGAGDTGTSAGRVAELETRIAYLERQLARSRQQQNRQERIDDINRRLIKYVSGELEQALLQAEQASRAKTEFLATMSHEIRSPLNIILGMGELLAETRLDELQKRYLVSLLAAGRQLFEQLTNILEFTRLESGRVVINREPFCFDLLVSSLRSMMETLAQNKGLTFHTLEPAPPLGERLGDLPKIKQILFNVLSNALKFTDHGTITLSIEDGSAHHGQHAVRFRVADTGIGIPPDRLTKIFDRFTQAENGLAVNRGGSGLGLAICRKLVHRLRGTIEVSSILGQGATFTVVLPLPPAPTRETEECPPVDLPADEHADALALASIRMLVAEDMAANVEVIRRYLAPFDVEIHHAENGMAAVDLFAEHRYDIVLMDIRMPGVDGITAMHRMNELGRHGVNAFVPIIAVTAHAFPEQVLSYLKKGFSGVLTKPFTKKDLIKTIGDFLRLFPAERQSHPEHDEADAETMQDRVPTLLQPLLGRVVETLERDLETIGDHFRNDNRAALQDSCHAIKGLAGLYGLHQFAGLLAALAAAAENAAHPLTDDALRPLQECLARLKTNWLPSNQALDS
ncbi:ATP-binding protein [Desulfofustis limnaeus]|uniref:histidine kinase n=1 Tax=Desulfofustis limnaeus TaxID=2740163 RepID=A0ABN6M6D0_9BACT|nr:ATP-binding protein [Desulfofustis limnaeus]BDD86667.1 hypothetical protein DPPLL_10320 [Desulfofustis limnaeus]